MSLVIKNLVAIEKKHQKQILNGINLTIDEGEVHFLFGPNGSGKSTLARCILNDNIYQISADELKYDTTSLLSLPSEKIAHLGVFLSFQHPVEIDGVSNIQYLKTLVNERHKRLNLPPIDTLELLDKVKSLLKTLEFDEKFLTRQVNKSFSGGEKKKNEILQLLLLEPTLVILDEIDSGVDIDALKTIVRVLKDYKATHTCSILVITHNMKLADMLDVDKFHIIKDGKIVLSSTEKSEILTLEKSGFKEI